MPLSASAFIRACREGGQLIENWLRRYDREHGAALYRDAAVALRSWQAAEDVVQESLIKVWQRCATFRGPGDPHAWVRQIVRNTLLDRLRVRRPETSLQADDGDLVPEAAAAVAALSLASDTGPEAEIKARQSEQTFRQCFAQFHAAHPQHATVLRWVAEDGLDNVEVEQLLGRTPGATREFLSQCRKKAKPFFAPWYALVKSGVGHD